MIGKGTFVINGTGHVIVSQPVRFPGVYFEITSDKKPDGDIYSYEATSSRSAWLKFGIDKRDIVFARLDRKHK